MVQPPPVPPMPRGQRPVRRSLVIHLQCFARAFGLVALFQPPPAPTLQHRALSGRREERARGLAQQLFACEMEGLGGANLE